VRHLVEKRVTRNFVPRKVVAGRAPGVYSTLRLLERLVLEVLLGFFGVGFEEERADEHFAKRVGVLLRLGVRDCYAIGLSVLYERLNEVQLPLAAFATFAVVLTASHGEPVRWVGGVVVRRHGAPDMLCVCDIIFFSVA